MGRVEGKVAFITGAARGQGRSHAVRLAEEGADIVAMDICGPAGNWWAPPSTPEDLAETVRLVEQADRRILARQGDVRDAGRVQEIADEAIAEFGFIDVVVSNAAISNFAPAWELTHEDWQNHIDTNLTGSFNVMKAILPSMISAGRGGSFIIIGSTSGNRGLPLNLHYVTAKHGLVGFMRGLAVEAGQFKIRVNAIHPGIVNSPLGLANAEAVLPLLDDQPARYRSIFDTPLPAENMIDPIDISHAVVYLASEESRYVTGLVLNADAGLSL
jgi:SDR family mycofactocin-dependent oxidoreductase